MVTQSTVTRTRKKPTEPHPNGATHAATPANPPGSPVTRRNPARVPVWDFDHTGEWRELESSALADCPRWQHAQYGFLRDRGFHMSREWPGDFMNFELFENLELKFNAIPHRWLAAVTENQSVQHLVLLADFPHLARFVRDCGPVFAL